MAINFISVSSFKLVETEQLETCTHSFDHMCSFMPAGRPGPPPDPRPSCMASPVPEPYLHRCLCCHHRRFPWMCHNLLLSSPAGRRSASHSGPGYICRCRCTSQGNPLQGKAYGMEVCSPTATCGHTHSRSSCLLGKCTHVHQHADALSTQGGWDRWEAMPPCRECYRDSQVEGLAKAAR